MEVHKGSNLIPGVPFALASAVLFGATPPIAKLLLGSVDPVLMAGLLYLGAGFGLSAFIVARRLTSVASSEAPLTRADVPWLAAAIAIGGVVGPLFLVFGLARTEASSASLLLNLESLATMAIAWVVFHENVDRRLLLGAAAILAGAVLLSWQGQGVALDLGAVLVAGACLAWGIDNNLTRKVAAADPLVIVAWKGLVAGAANTSIAFAQGAGAPEASVAFACGALGFFGIGVSLVFFVLALRHLGAARTGAYYSLAPFIGAVLAILILAEPLTVRLVVAAILMGIGLWFHLAERHEHLHDHRALEHEHSHVHDEHHQHAHDGPVTEPHSHRHRHAPMRHRHVHYPDLHHQHRH